MNFSDNEFYRESTTCIFRHLDLKKAMSLLLEHLKNYMPLDYIFLWTYIEELRAVKFFVHLPENPYLKAGQLIKVPDEMIEKIKQGYQKGIKIYHRPEKDAGYRKMFTPIIGNNISGIHMVLSIGRHKIGTVGFMARGRDRYTDDHLRRCALIREPLSIAFYNTIKYQEVLKLKNILADHNHDLKVELKQSFGSKIIGDNAGLRITMDKVINVASLNSPVLLSGETGVGKEIIANAIHNASPRKEKPLIKINCGAIPDSLIDSELFGHEKGAFTGADARKYGRFERANKGTIFLDEIAELPLHAQTRMLRIIQFGEFERVGGTETIHVDIRIIAATHKNLADLVASNLFRRDLFFRINVFPIEIPPLRQRKEDIPELVNYFIEKKSKEIKPGQIFKLAPVAMERLLNYNWPGNVRELENVVEREIIMNNGDPMTFQNFFSDDKVEDPSASFNDGEGTIPLDLLIELHIRRTLKKTKGKIYGVGGAAELLGINPNTLRGKMMKLKIPIRYGKIDPNTLD